MKHNRKSFLALFLALSLVAANPPIKAYAIENDAIDNSGGLEVSSSDFYLDDDLLVDELEIDQAPINPEFNRQETADEAEKFGLNVDPLKIYTDYDTLEEEVPNRQKASFIPAQYDLRNFGRVTPMRNQGPNGSCWAFATYGSAESVLLPRENTDFSEKNLRNTHGYDWGPKDGGTNQVSAAYLSRWAGPISERDEPYSPYDFYSPAGLRPVKELDKALYIPDVRNQNDARVLKEAIMDYGAAYTVVNGSEYYTNMYTMGHNNPGQGYANHAVTIVGWDDNYSASNFKWGAPGNGAWICKNSWGSHWGTQGGYYYVSYYDAHIAKSNCIFILKNKEANKSIWYHDYLGMTSNIGRGSVGWFSNVFGPAKQNIEISEVGIFVPTNNVSYEIYVNTNIGGNSGFNNRVLVASGKFDFAGYQTVKFRPQQIPNGAYFAPIVKFTTTGYPYPIPVEKPIWGYSSRATAARGQSYISYDGYNWSDVTNQMANTNVCVKAFTKPSGSGYIDNTPIDPIVRDKKVQSISVDKDLINLTIGGRENISAEALPTDASNKNLSYASSNTYVATVSSNGEVRALREGSATITISATDGSGVATSVNVTVSKADYNQGNIFNVNVYLPKENLELGQSLPVTVNVRDKYQRNLRYALVNVSLAGGASKEAYTDQNGNFKVDLDTRHISQAGTYKLNVRVTGDTFEDYNNSYDITIGDTNTPEPNNVLDIKLSTDKDEYEKGERIPIKIQTHMQGRAIPNARVDIEITTPDGAVHKNTGTTNYNGMTTYNYSPDVSAKAGTYQVLVRARTNTHIAENSINFVVKEKDMSLKLLYNFDKKIYYYGDRANIRLSLKDAEQRPVRNARLAIRVTGPNNFIYDIEKTTDYNGNTSMYIEPNSSMKAGVYTVEVRTKDDSIGNLDASFDVEFIDNNSKPMSLSMLDLKSTYKPRTRPCFTAHIKDEKNLNLRYANVKFSIEDSNGKVLSTSTCTTTYTGKVSFTGPALNEGDYKLKLTVDRDTYKQISEEYSFRVAR